MSERRAIPATRIKGAFKPNERALPSGLDAVAVEIDRVFRDQWSGGVPVSGIEIRVYDGRGNPFAWAWTIEEGN